MSYAQSTTDRVTHDPALITMQCTKREFFNFMSFIEKAESHSVRVGNSCSGRYLYFLNKDETIEALRKANEELQEQNKNLKKDAGGIYQMSVKLKRLEDENEVLNQSLNWYRARKPWYKFW